MTAISLGTISAAEGVLPVLAALEGLAALDDLALLGILADLPRSEDGHAAACEVLVGRYRSLVTSCVRRYRRSPETGEDLMQVGYVGLVKAINNFDPSFGRGLAAYAQPYITGEIKRHFRDKRWQITVKRSVKELAAEVRTATSQLTQELGRTPAEPDLIRYLAVSASDLRDAQLAEMAFRMSSLDAPLHGQPGAASLAELLGEDDPRMEHMLSMLAVATHWGELPEREQQILVMRFYGGMTQVQVGQQLGISQMHVSRLLAHALGYLRPRVLGLLENRSN